MSKYRPNNHIVGKVYDLSQENMNAMLAHIDRMSNIILSLNKSIKITSENNYKYKLKNIILKIKIDKMKGKK